MRLRLQFRQWGGGQRVRAAAAGGFGEQQGGGEAGEAATDTNECDRRLFANAGCEGPGRFVGLGTGEMAHTGFPPCAQAGGARASPRWNSRWHWVRRARSLARALSGTSMTIRVYSLAVNRV